MIAEMKTEPKEYEESRTNINFIEIKEEITTKDIISEVGIR